MRKFRCLRTAILLAALLPAVVSAEDFDVVVIGAGGAGLTAAITAKEAGASVVVLEKLDHAGGNTLLADSGMNAAGTKEQLAAGVLNDDPGRFYADSMTTGEHLGDPALIRVMTERSAEAVDWLIDELGVPLCFRSETGAGQSRPRLHVPCSGAKTGPELVHALERRAAKDGIDVRTGHPVTGILMKDGRVSAVTVRTPDGEETLQARAVVLATGGYGANLGLIAELHPEFRNMITTNHREAMGEGLGLARMAGGAVTGLGLVQLHPTVEPGTGHLFPEQLRLQGGILVNAEGRRFANELMSANALSREMEAQPDGAVWLVLDQAVRDTDRIVQRCFDAGHAVQAETPEALARKLGLPADALTETFRSCRRASRAEAADAFGRNEMPSAFDRPPYFAVRVMPAVHYTIGGVEINVRAEVLAQNDRTVPGLFAAGEVTGGIHGQDRVDDSALTDAVVFGRIAGAGAAAFSRNPAVPEGR